MNTLEMMKALGESPEKRFVTDWYPYGKCELYVEDGKLMIKRTQSNGQSLIVYYDLNVNWKVEQPVDFNIALAAWSNGKDIYNECFGKKNYYKGNYQSLLNNNGRYVNKQEITEGKWYVID